MNIIDDELQKLNEDILDDVESLIEKYMEIIALDIPEYDENYAKEKLLNIIEKSINKIINNTEDKN